MNLAGPELAEVIFDGVEAYVLDGDALGTIVLDISEVNALELYGRWAEPLRAAWLHGGHASW
jgi:hypothetical protein